MTTYPEFITSITRILRNVEARKEGAKNELFEAVYDKLREMAQQIMKSWRNSDLVNPTALVHECYLRLNNTVVLEKLPASKDFQRFAGRAMLNILKDISRSSERRQRREQFAIAITANNRDVSLQRQLDLEVLAEIVDERSAEEPTFFDFIIYLLPQLSIDHKGTAKTIEDLAENLGISVYQARRKLRKVKAELLVHCAE